MGKMENPNLLSLEGESKQIKDVFTDKFDGVVYYLHATEKFIDSRDISTTYLVQGPKLPCSCWLHTLLRLRALQ